MSLLAAVVYRVRKHRQQFGDLLASGSGMNRSLFIRLFSMSFLLLWVFLPMQFYILATNVTFHFHAYSWSLVHGPDWWHIVKLPSGGTVHYDRWIRASLGIVVFLFFGLGTEAQRMYREWLIRAGLDRVFPALFLPKREDGLLARLFNRYFGFLKRPATYIFYRLLLGMNAPSS
jgi:pheromone a factor receptor